MKRSGMEIRKLEIHPSDAVSAAIFCAAEQLAGYADNYGPAELEPGDLFAGLLTVGLLEPASLRKHSLRSIYSKTSNLNGAVLNL
jgi:hypothetical protein